MIARAEDLRLLRNLLLVLPYELEGTHTITDDSGITRKFYLDHGWDNTFGHAFGTVGAIGPQVTDVTPGDFIYFTRHAYEEWTDGDGIKWLFVNREDVQGVIPPGASSEVDAKGVVEAENRVDGYAA